MKYTGRQDKYIETLNNYINENGVKINFIAKELGIARETLSRFRNKKVDLHITVLKNLNNYLKERA